MSFLDKLILNLKKAKYTCTIFPPPWISSLCYYCSTAKVSPNTCSNN